MKNRWNTTNGIFVKGTVITMLEEGKSRNEIVDFFYAAGNGGHFLWGTSTKESIEKSVDEIIEINNKPKKTAMEKCLSFFRYS